MLLAGDSQEATAAATAVSTAVLGRGVHLLVGPGRLEQVSVRPPGGGGRPPTLGGVDQTGLAAEAAGTVLDDLGVVACWVRRAERGVGWLTRGVVAGDGRAGAGWLTPRSMACWTSGPLSRPALPAVR